MRATEQMRMILFPLKEKYRRWRSRAEKRRREAIAGACPAFAPSLRSSSWPWMAAVFPLGFPASLLEGCLSLLAMASHSSQEVESGSLLRSPFARVSPVAQWDCQKCVDLNLVFFASKAKRWPSTGRTEAEGLCFSLSPLREEGTQTTKFHVKIKL